MTRIACLALALALSSCTDPVAMTRLAAADSSCGDGLCALGEGETCASCPEDCGACGSCGDGRCAFADAESCELCPEDCGACDPCGDGLCALADGESCEVCPEDCGACGSCGDGECAAGAETCADCPADCGACAVCGDGTCDPGAGEECAACAEDCGACAGCGDGRCDLEAAESCGSCAQDCGACDPCGDGVCAADESCASCAEDCGACMRCGDGVCDWGSEDCTGCTQDCGACPPRQGCIQGEFHAYHGNLHAHTSYSDGQATPGQGFAHARQAGLDFMWITDHREMLTAGEWSACRSQADTANDPGSFVAGCGYEMCIFSTGGSKLGHLNTLFTGSLMPKPVGLPALYQALADCSPCVGQWNHPPWPGTFHDYTHHAVGDDAMRLVEFSGSGGWDAKWDAYFTALRNGWRVAPASNEDNHSLNWGDSHRATGVWASALSRTALRQAIRQRRSFAAFDDTASIKLVADGACFMGSVLKGLGRTELTVVARDRQAGDGFRRIWLYGPDGQALASRACEDQNPCTATFSRRVEEKTFFVAVAVQSDDDKLVSAPIWFEP